MPVQVFPASAGINDGNEYRRAALRQAPPPQRWSTGSAGLKQDDGIRPTGGASWVGRDPKSNEGNMVAARLKHKVTLKRFHRERGTIVWLLPIDIHPEHTPIRAKPGREDIDVARVLV